MIDHVANREVIIQELRKELVGPSPYGEELDCTGDIVFEDKRLAYRPYRQLGTGEEIISQGETPCKRYGVGVLYPIGISSSDEFTTTEEDGSEALEGLLQESGELALQEEVETQASEETAPQWPDDRPVEGAEPDDFDVSSANSFMPSSMAVSFLVRVPEGASIEVSASGGRYRLREVKAGGTEQEWWLREGVAIEAEFQSSEICSDVQKVVGPSSVNSTNTDGMDLRVEMLSRPYEGNTVRLITICLVNRSQYTGFLKDDKCLFQAGFNIKMSSPDGSAQVLPYPSLGAAATDLEELALELLYRNHDTYAVGHGCAAVWGKVPESSGVDTITAECMPTFQLPSTTPDIHREDGTRIEVSMSDLAGLGERTDGLGAIVEIIGLYEDWASRKEEEARELDERFRDIAEENIRKCRGCAARMRSGLEYLQSDMIAMQAFRLANYAVLLQQIQYRREARGAEFSNDGLISYTEAYKEPDVLEPPEGKGMWRPFQIAFLLMAIRSIAEDNSPERDIVELIWFPTGGGKTEAYLALSAFSIFLRRLRDKDDTGTAVLMRYTLRLLTSQQFLRASGLICAMEYLRRRHTEDFGEEEFNIGIWLGGGTTPNTRDQAIGCLRSLVKGDQRQHNLFLLNRCPWCGAQMGPVRKKPGRKHAPKVIGYERRGSTVVMKCPDRTCDFHNGLPCYLIDEDIYELRPSMVIGTVDKFAILAWKPLARAIFGLEPDGSRLLSPPSLIVQDELHLISGPLGSMVGIYEALIDELCTDYRPDEPLRPKVVCSTATIRRYEEQVKSLFGRGAVELFPPPGLEISDSFFARHAKNDDGSYGPGLGYVGVFAPGLGSMQTTQVRAFSALLQAPMSFTEEERDPWWTLMVFFNTLRELGTTLSLFQADIRYYFKAVKNRYMLDYSDLRRFPPAIMELTGRIRSDKVPKSISALEVVYGSEGNYPRDVCLSSSIIEVGIDIDRLSLMAVVGQPKTTSQYIQVTGRVGRKWWERPGLVVTLYNVNRSRDKSIFEKFQSYHERLYAQVEPTSVTPFSAPVLDRALHALMAAYVRQAGTEEQARSPYPFPGVFLEQLSEVMKTRVIGIDQASLPELENAFQRRVEEWRAWERTEWTRKHGSTEAPLLVEAGAFIPPEWRHICWPTPMSMRNVDAECQAEITTLYLEP